MFAGAMVLQGVFRALDSGPLEASYVDATLAANPDARIESGLGAGSSVLSVAIASGALLSGGLVALDPFDSIETLALPLLVAFALHILNLAAIVMLLTEVRMGRGARAIANSIRAVPGVIRTGLRLLCDSRVLLALVLVELSWGFAMVTFENLFPVRLSEVIGDTDNAAALMGPVSSAAWFASAAGATLIRYRQRAGLGVARSAALLRVLQGVRIVDMGVLAGLVGVVTAYLAGYVTHGASNPMHMTLLHRQVQGPRRRRRGRPALGDVRLSRVNRRSELRVGRFATASAFLETAGGFLGEREAEHNLIFGICANLSADPGFPTAPPYLAAVWRDGRVVAAAVMTPPWNLVLSWAEDPEAVPALAADLDAGGISVPGTVGPVASARAFADAWSAAHSLTSRLAVAERIYRLERVVPPVGVRGQVRIATEADRDLLVDWVDAFLGEALDRRSPDEAAVLVDRSFRTGSRTWYLWEDGGPVSMAASGGPTPNGIRIGPVYTPRELRRRGYASAVTAATSLAELDNGRRFIFLFTDLSNPTSNKIYQQIGYEPVIDVDQIAFVAAGGEDPAT